MHQADVRRVELRGDGDGRVVAIDVEGDLEELLARVDAAVPVRWMARLNRRLHPGFAPVTLPRFLLADPVARVAAALAAELAARRPPPPCAPTTAGLPPPGGATEERRGEAPTGEGEGAPVGGEGAPGEGPAVEGPTGEGEERPPAP